MAGSFTNPFKPGAGHMPPYLAGRTHEQDRFRTLLDQPGSITENLILTGLRGVGKTVLLECLRPIAHQKRWLWAGTDMNESASVTEERMAIRLITDLSVITAAHLSRSDVEEPMGFGVPNSFIKRPVSYSDLINVYNDAPGLVIDKLKIVLSLVWKSLEGQVSGIVFAYDEAQMLQDRAKKDEYPLSMILELFQSVQKQGMRFLLVLTGLPTLFPQLVDARTYSERMFHVLFLKQLPENESRSAIETPMKDKDCPLTFSENTIVTIMRLSGGYPYFIQFICKEIFEIAISKYDNGDELVIPENAIVTKLDNDFFAARWDMVTDRERDLLLVTASLPSCDDEFTVNDIVSLSQTRLERPFSASHVNQLLVRMAEKGLIFKNRHGKYSFAVPLMSRFIRRQISAEADWVQ